MEVGGYFMYFQNCAEGYREFHFMVQALPGGLGRLDKVYFIGVALVSDCASGASIISEFCTIFFKALRLTQLFKRVGQNQHPISQRATLPVCT